MNSPSHLARAWLTLLGAAAFLILALGSDEPSRSSYPYSPPPPSPEIVGQQTALTWAKSNSTDLREKIDQVERRREHAQSEISKLETLKAQFPKHADEVTAKIGEWQQVVIELDSALTSVRQHASDAYVAHQGKGENKDATLKRAYRQWMPRADRAIALAKKQWARSGGPRRERELAR